MKLVFFCVLSLLPQLALVANAAFAEEIREDVERADQGTYNSFSITDPMLDGLVADINKLRRAVRNPHQLVLLASNTMSSHVKHTFLKKPAFDVGAAVQEMGKTTQVPAMLGLVSGMYDAWKDKIGEANKHEAEGKKELQGEIKHLEEQKAKYKGDANATKTYDNIEKYWRRQREISHRQYHTALKLMHGGMVKFKTVMTAMSDVVSGKKPSGEELHAIQQLAPEVVFLQTSVKELRVWSASALNELRAVRNPDAKVGIIHQVARPIAY